MSAGSQVCG